MGIAAEIGETSESASGRGSGGGDKSIRAIKDEPAVHDQKAVKRESRRLPGSALAVAVPASRGARIPVPLKYHMGISVCIADHVRRVVIGRALGNRD